MVGTVTTAAGKRCVLLTALLLSAAPHAVYAQAPADDALSRQARYQEEKGRYDLSRETWLKLLRIDADNADALAGLAMAEAKSGRSAAAQVYLDRLREKHPDASGIRRIEDAIRSGSYDQDRLQGPRALARSGRFDEAVAGYQQIFGSSVPDGRLGLEYWQTVAGTKDGWAPARAGIEQLVKNNPDEPLYRLALAQHLTYREETRREGIAGLSRLGSEASVAAPAEQAWAQALIWLGAKPSDEPLYKAYLADHKNAQVAAKLDSLRSGQAAGSAAAAAGYPGADAAKAPTPQQLRGQAVQQAFDTLNDNRPDEAGAMFEQIIAQYPDSDDAVGGLGIVRLRQERYSEARQYLDQASLMAPRRASRWKEALGSARFWETVRAGQAARTAGDLAGAENLLRKAIDTDPDVAAKTPSVKDSLADVLSENGDNDGAEKLYRDILARQPDDAGASRGLMAVLVKLNRLPEAINLAERLPPDQKRELGNLGALKGQYLRGQAKLATDAKDDEQGESLLKQALLEDPESPWTRLDLSRIYQRQHRIREANTLVDGLLTGGKSMPEALYIKALLLAEQDDFLTGLNTLEQIPYEQRTQPMADLQRRLWVRYQTRRAGVLTRYGHPQEAAQILQQVEPFAQDSPELLGALATGFADVGQDGRALNYIRQALSRQAVPDPGLRLQYASLLFKLRQDAEFEVVMEDLLKNQSWTEQQSLDLANLRIAYRLRQADLVREEGNLARAYEYLEPLLRVNPNDPRLVMALARLYGDAKEYDKAAELYRRALQTDPDNLDAYKGAIGAALSQDQPDQAQTLIDQALRLDPQNPRLYALAARAAKARGEDGRALQLYQQALRLDQERGGASEFGDGRYTPQLYLLDPVSGPVNTPSYGRADEPVPVQGDRPAEALAAGASGVERPTRSAAVRLATAAPAVKKKQDARRLTPPAPVWAAAEPARVAAARPRPLRGDYALVALPRGWRSGGRLIKVSGPQDAPQAAVLAPGPAWVQTGPDRYTYRLQSTPAAAAPVPTQNVPTLPAYVPRQLTASPQLSAPPRAARPSTLREDVLRGMGEITGQPVLADSLPPVQAPLSPPRTAPRSGYPAGDARQSLAPAQPQPQMPMAAAPAASVLAPGPVVTAAPLGVGATEAEYARQGVRLLPAPAPEPMVRAAASVPMPTPGFAGPAPPAPVVTAMPTYVTVPPAPAPAPAAPVYDLQPYRLPVTPSGGMQLRSDPVLATPDFVLQRRRPAADQPNEVLREIADLNAQRSSYAAFGLSIRNRGGQSGLDKLTDLETPVEFSVAGIDAGRFKLRAVPVVLDAGTVAGSQIPAFGAMALVPNNTGYRFSQQESGIALGAAYQIADLRLDVGSSPLGFPVETLVGGLNWRPHVDRLSFKIDLSRRSVTDSLLSYAGTKDPATGNTWGGVTKNGGRLDLAYDYGPFGVYANGSYHVLVGQNVAQNNVAEAGAGFYARAVDRRDMRVTYGLNLTTFFYDKSLRRFTYGHGGYFSPQNYFALAVPVEWSGGTTRFSYKLNGAIGIQSFHEDASPAFPNNSELQTAIQTFVVDNPDSTAVANYPSASSTGIGFNFGGAFEYLIAPNLVAGARFGIDNARDYKEATALGYLRYAFNGQRRVSAPPSLLMPYYDFGEATE